MHHVPRSKCSNRGSVRAQPVHAGRWDRSVASHKALGTFVVIATFLLESTHCPIRVSLCSLAFDDYDAHDEKQHSQGAGGLQTSCHKADLCS